ncbi:AraC family transcriptional regulator [Campylobacter hyointestinalis]|uniref:AraC family transcriptional regulator n=1 Tax=Campylobacter hyointestinalis TaxID=198 RepID=A0A562XAA5_CAMHY|nr:AraC family transcriptional regulator [Campylobacter hyointestinalis]TWO19078.1 AraC family transcriptional regulator [Campylobacter hyointestinalis]
MIDEICNILNSQFPKDGVFNSKFEWLYFYKISKKSEFIHAFYEPSFCIILSGQKSVEIKNQIFFYDNSRYLIAPMYLSTKVAITKTPYLSLKIAFNVGEILEIIKELEIKKINNTKDLGLFFGNIDDSLLNAIFRLVGLESSDKFRANLIKKEILYMLLSGDGGDFLRSYTQNGSIKNIILKAINEIKSSYKDPINIENLARNFNISSSSFYSNFKEITGLSPLVFIKHLRLEEAKNILINSSFDAHSVALMVGYESPTQFSREYAKMYGLPPITHKKLLKSQGF